MGMAFEAMTAHQRIQNTTGWVLEQTWLASLWGSVMYGKQEVGRWPDVPTACTNGIDNMFNEDFILTLPNLKQVRFVLLHEEFHKVLKQLIVWKHLMEKNAYIANLAMDAVINLMIKDLAAQHPGTIEIPETIVVNGQPCKIVLDEKFRDMSTLEVFRIMLQEQEDKKKQQQQSSQNDKGDKGDMSQEYGTSFDKHDPTAAQAMDEKEAKEHIAKMDRALEGGRIAAEKQAGMGRGGASDAIGALVKPKVDWREALREFANENSVGSDFSTWKRPRRRAYASGIYLPSRYGERVETLMEGTDTSGSMWSFKEMVRSEVKAIFDTVDIGTLHHIEWDDCVQTHKVISKEEGDTLTRLPVTGGGGTDVNCLADYLIEKKLEPKALIILTDGYLSNGWAEKKWSAGINILWVIFGNPDARPPCGKVLHVSRRDFV